MDDQKLPVTVTVKPEPLPAEWTLNDTFALARELAVDHTPSTFKLLLKKHNVTEGQFATLQEQPAFRGMLITQIAEWESLKSTEQRIRHRARLGLEAALLPISERIANKTEPLANVAQMAKVLADVGALSRPEPNAHGSGDKITITLDFGADTRLSFEKTRNVDEVQPVIEGAVEEQTVQGNAEGPSPAIPLLPKPQENPN